MLTAFNQSNFPRGSASVLQGKVVPNLNPISRNGGFTLVELLVTITIGLFIVMSMTTMLANNLRSSSQLAASNRLKQEMRSAMTLMVRDIRRAGYWANATSGIGATAAAYSNSFATVTITDFNPPAGVSNNCILYQYNINGTGNTPANNERFGFRFNPTTKSVQARTSGSNNVCNNTSDTWESLTDPGTTEITSLTFNLVQSAPFYVPPASAPPNPNIVSRTVEITLKAQLKSDSTVRQTLFESVKIENDLFNPN